MTDFQAGTAGPLGDRGHVNVPPSRACAGDARPVPMRQVITRASRAESDSDSRGRISHADRAGAVPAAEREQLAATLGALLRRERRAAGYGTRRLAMAVACARSTITRLESGQQRPRECTLRYIASVLDPDHPCPLADRLVAAAGASLRPDTPGTIRQHRIRANAAILAGRRPLSSDLTRRLLLHRRADAAAREAGRLVDTPGALDDPVLLDRILALRETACALRSQAGPPVTLRVGKVEIRAGWGA